MLLLKRQGRAFASGSFQKLPIQKGEDRLIGAVKIGGFADEGSHACPVKVGANLLRQAAEGKIGSGCFQLFRKLQNRLGTGDIDAGAAPKIRWSFFGREAIRRLNSSTAPKKREPVT